MPLPSRMTDNTCFIINELEIDAIRNGDYESVDDHIYDGRAARTDLETCIPCGFALVESPSLAGLESDVDITPTYYEEVHYLLLVPCKLLSGPRRRNL